MGAGWKMNKGQDDKRCRALGVKPKEEIKIKNVLSMCFELRRSLMRGELNFPSGVNRQSVIKWLRAYYTYRATFSLLILLCFARFFLVASSTSKGEIDILLNPHNLLIKIIISFHCGGGWKEQKKQIKLTWGRKSWLCCNRHNNIIYFHILVATFKGRRHVELKPSFTPLKKLFSLSLSFSFSLFLFNLKSTFLKLFFPPNFSSDMKNVFFCFL